MAKEQAKETQGPERARAGGEQNITRRDNASSQPMPSASPVTFMRRFVEDLDRLFDGFGFGTGLGGSVARSSGGAGEAMWVPPLEIFERDRQLVIRAEVPGLSKDQIKVEFQEGQLVISGERSQENEEKREGFYRSERSYGRFYRAVALPEGTNPDQAKATFSNGVLEITLPAPQRPQPTRIEIQEGAKAEAKHSQRAA